MDDSLLLQKRNLYLTSLLNETLPLSLITSEVLDDIHIRGDEDFGLIHMLFDNRLKNTIESKNENIVADWKSTLHTHILEPLNHPAITNTHMLNLAPYTRTIVFSYWEIDPSHLADHLITWYESVKTFLQQSEQSRLLAFVNLKPTSFTKIGKRYKELRELQNYQYTLGMGQLIFYDTFKPKDIYSVTEYKYIQKYETQLVQESFETITKTFQELKDFLKSELVKDSKLIYIYKELMSITIRYLYAHETEHLNLIETLNNHINNFHQSFDDLEDVHDFMLQLSHELAIKNSDLANVHPHIRKVLKAIHLRYPEDLALTHISQELNLSDAYVSRLFKETMQIPFKDYLTKYRLKKIKDLLKTSSKSISEIAHLCGYQHPDQMTRIFKKYEKTTPRAFRQKEATYPSQS